MLKKQLIPWQLKVIAKLICGFLRIDYKFLAKVGMINHGKMNDFEFAQRTFNRHMELALSIRGINKVELTSGTMLELGPGDSFLSGVIAFYNGFKSSKLVDIGHYEHTELEPLKAAVSYYGDLNYLCSLEDTSKVKCNQIFDKFQIEYLTKGLGSLRQLRDCSISYAFSNSVIQHISRRDVNTVFSEFYRLQKLNSISVHTINFTDHFSGGFVNQKIPSRIMELELIKRSFLYTNALSFHEIMEIISNYSFQCVVLEFEIIVNKNISEMKVQYELRDFMDMFKNVVVRRATIALIKIR